MPLQRGCDLPEDKHFTYDGWDVVISIDRISQDGFVSGHVDLSRDGKHKCRIALTGKWSAPDEAKESLTMRAQAWADEWKQRPHVRDSGFADL
ncbi:MAG: hypothetical protein KKC85_09450 [Gammaproteobacteria bacterium]|nr:hypothetical protein [Gammaproteobacteria bacterium]MBU1530529.1 hypothetical protein [Gammaproteobacteria bacterium]MBU2286648.1 hypothetical protein [Gammaproteobacteria bacterium]